MPVLPSKLEELMSFGEAHANVWTQTAAQIGLTPQEATDVRNAVAFARTKVTAAQVARNAAKSATLNQTAGVGNMRDLLTNSIKKIRLFAESTNDPAVYALADIPPPAQPMPTPRPTTPTNMSAEIIPGGSLKIIFKAVNARSSGGGGPVTYVVSRKLENETAFRQIGTTGTSRAVEGLPRGFKAFVDSTLPGGANNFQYQIVGQRGDTFGEPSEIFTVVIGMGSGGGLSMQTGTLKMAA